jgi:hypothetical protein
MSSSSVPPPGGRRGHDGRHPKGFFKKYFSKQAITTTLRDGDLPWVHYFVYFVSFFPRLFGT